MLLLMISSPAFADIQFKEVTQEAGISHSGTTYGASWGDFNGDGWPGVWVGNHDTMPSLYINNRNGTFTNIINQVWNGDPRADKHGAAWADFDNDGHQDLIEAVDAAYIGASLIPARGQNLFFINQDGRLEEAAKRFGLDVRVEARSPLWLDADRDGRLDVLIMAHRGSRVQQASILFRQTANGFKEFNKASGFQDGEVSRSEYHRNLLNNIFHLRFRYPSQISSASHQEFAQLADLNGDGDLDLVVYSQPLRVYSIRTIPFEEITHTLGFPNLSQVGDVAIEDFDGDQRLDMYMTIGPYRSSDLRQPTPFELKATILGHEGGDKRLAKGMQFRTAGEVNFTIYPQWLHLSKVYLGASGGSPVERSFTVSPNDLSLRGPVPEAVLEQGVVSIVYDPVTHVWTLRNGVLWEFVDVIVHSNEPIDKIQTLGFEPFTENGTENGVDALLMHRGDRFRLQTLSGEVGVPTACHSVAAGDFDNDMDIDLYLVCTGPIENLPNRLYENDGKGNFTLVPDAGGAAGSKLGRGDVVAIADYDRDGFLDLFVTNGADPSSPFVDEGPHQLFRNQGNGNHWIEIDLEGTVSNRDGIGASVVLEAGGVVQIRGQGGGMHRFTQNHQRIHFGLATYKTVDRLTIRWPSGIVQRLENIAANQILTIRESR
jgi:ASPIC and UnbV/FG-GAP-like repeat